MPACPVAAARRAPALGHPLRRWLSVFLALVLVRTRSPATAPLRADAPPRRGSLDSLLARFERGAPLPPLIAGLPLDGGRAWAILLRLVPPCQADRSGPASVRHGLLHGLKPLAVARAGTRLGHAMIGWRCPDGTFGLSGKTRGDPGHLRALSRERVRIAAFEIAPTACQRMRGALGAYVVHPSRPELRDTDLPDPAPLRGEGCAGIDGPRRLPAGEARREEIVRRVGRWLDRDGRATPMRMGAARAVVLYLR